MDPEDKQSFENGVRMQLIEQLKNVGTKFINSPKVIMNLNWYFRKNDTFPHPNIQIEMEWKYESLFLEMFPEVKIQLREWETKNLSVLNCDVIKRYITEQVFPKVYQTYLSETSHNNSPTLDGFLAD